MKENLYTLQSIDEELDRMYNDASSRHSDIAYIVTYKGRRLTVSSGKNVWRTAGHAKAAIKCHFDYLAVKYQYPPTDTYVDGNGIERQNYDYTQSKKRRKEYYDKLMSMVKIVELTSTP